MRRGQVTQGAGFTLVELLVTLSLMAVVFGVLFSMIGGGIRVWGRLKCGALQEQKVYVALDQMRRGLHAVHPFKPIPFKGSHNRLDFPVLLNVESEEEEVAREPGRMSFYFDLPRKVLCQSESFYRGSRNRQRRENCKTLAENIDSVAFSYQGYNSKLKVFSNASYWSKEVLPVSVKVELSYHEPCAEKKSKKEFWIALPVGPVR